MPATDSATGPSSRFKQSLAVVIGVDTYEPSIPQLRSAVADARAVAAALAGDHGFAVRALFDGEVTVPSVEKLLGEELPGRLGADDRIVLYFAGHGIALDGDDGPAGHLLLSDARRSHTDTLLPMRALHDHLTALPCRHALIVLDCCFAGSFRWSSVRHATAAVVTRLYRERYERFIDSAAWQVLTSAASDQPAMDRLARDRGEGGSSHSPFAAALLRGLRGAADYTGDGIITASELGLHLREEVEKLVEGAGRRQTPQLFTLDRHGRGEFVFQVPGRTLDLVPAPALTRDRSPYRGLESYEEVDAPLFFGRDAVITRLASAVEERPLTVVTGPSGTGKSSLVKAGLVRALRARGGWRIAGARRPGAAPLDSLRLIAAELAAVPSKPDPVQTWLDAVGAIDLRAGRVLVILDQFEELLSHRARAEEQAAYLGAVAKALTLCSALRVVVTIRSDVEPLFQDGPLGRWWSAGRFPVPPMSRAELREVIERPASEKVLYFEPTDLVDRLVDDVALLPAPLPLLSFALSELYRRYCERGAEDRTLRESDYAAMGSVARALTRRATELHDRLVGEDPAFAVTMRNLVLRMTTSVAGELARRRVPRGELAQASEAENRRTDEVLERFQTARLVVRGREQDGAEDDLGYVEPAHDELVRGWDKVGAWLQEFGGGRRELLQSVGASTRLWIANARRTAYLWHGDPRLAQAVQLAGRPEPLLNRDESVFVRASRWRRVRGRAVGLTTLLAVLVTLSLSTRCALRSADEAKASAAAAERSLALSYEEQGRGHVLAGSPAHALPYLVAARERGVDTPGLRMLFARARRQLWLVSIRHRPDRGGIRVNSAAFSADGSRVVTAGKDGTARVWDAATGAPITPPLELGGEGKLAAFSPDGARVVTSVESGPLQLWDARTGAPVSQPLPDTHVSEEHAFSPDGARVVTWERDSVSIRETATGERIGEPLKHFRVVHAVFSPDGARLATSDFGGVRIWDAASHALLVGPLDHLPRAVTAVFSPDGARLLTADLMGGVRLWDASTGRLMARNALACTSVSFSPDGSMIAGAAGNAWAKIWLPPGGTGQANQESDANVANEGDALSFAHGGLVMSAVFSPDGARLLTASTDGTAQVWNAATGQPVESPLQHDADVQSASFSPDGDRILTASGDRAFIWQARSGELMTATSSLPEDERQVAFSPDGRHALVSSEEGPAQMWDAATGKFSQVGIPGRFLHATFSSDGAHLMLLTDHDARLWNLSSPHQSILLQPVEGLPVFWLEAGGARALVLDKIGLRVWDTTTGQVLSPPLENNSVRNAVAISPDKTRIAIIDRDHSAVLRDVATGKPVLPPLRHAREVTDVAFSPDGAWIITASGDSIRRWSAATGEPVPPVLRHPGVVDNASFSPDGARVVTVSDDGAARIWDVASGRILTFLVPGHAAELAAFSPEGGRVILWLNRATQVWDATTGKLLAELQLGQDDILGSAQFSPDGSRVAVTSMVPRSRVWNVSLDDQPIEEWRALAARCVPYVIEEGLLIYRGAPSGLCRAPDAAAARALVLPRPPPAPPVEPDVQ